MHLEFLFPVAIGIEESLLSEEENAKVIDACYDVYSKTTTSENGWLSGSSSPYNTINSYSLLNDDRFSLLIEKISEAVNNFAKVYSDYDDYVCAESWFNIYRGQQFQEPHAHSFPSIFSAVYYPLAPEGSGKIVFQSPHSSVSNEPSLVSDNSLNHTSHWYHPSERSLLVFKSDMRHYVLPSKSDGDRISVASNFIIDPQKYYDRFRSERK